MKKKMKKTLCKDSDEIVLNVTCSYFLEKKIIYILNE